MARAGMVAETRTGIAFIAMLFLTGFTGMALVRYARERRMLAHTA
jgi:hypothetical protein